MRSLLPSILIITGLPVFAQQHNYTLTNYTAANGLADNSVTSIIQDSRGFMWFGTREGLSRFDGSGFKNFFSDKTNSSTLPGNSINSLHEFKPGYLLILASGRITTLNTFTQQFEQLPQFGNRVVYGITRLQNELFSASIQDSCLILGKDLAITGILSPPLNHKGTVPEIMPINDKTWLVSTTLESFFYHPADKKFIPFLNSRDWSPRDGILKYLFYDKKNKWLYLNSYWEGLYRVSLDGKLLYNWKRETIPHGLSDLNISFISQKNDSTLWIGTNEGGGMLILNSHTNLVSRIQGNFNTQSGNERNAFFVNYTDKENNEWLGTSFGVSKLNISASGIKTWSDVFKETKNTNNLINITKASDGGMYVPVFGSAYCYKINSGNDHIALLSKDKLPDIWCMNNSGNNLVFTGGGTSITEYDPLTGFYRQQDFLQKYFPSSDVVILAFRHSNGDKWYSGNNGGGFVRVSAGDGSIHHYQKDGPRGNFSISYYSTYVEDKNGDLWFGVNKSNKLVHWDMRKDLFNEVSFDKIKGITEDVTGGITDIVMDSAYNIWVAFDGGGVAKYDQRNNIIIPYTLQNGLPTDFAYALKFDNKGRLWIGTLKGLSCLLVGENRFVNFTKSDGLPADYFDERCIYFDSSTHQLWAGSKNTLMRFDPDMLLNTFKKQFPVYIDEIMVNGKKFTGDDTVRLSFSPSQNNLQFRFIAVDLNSGKNMEYSYMLLGADKDWIYNDRIQTASYANLPSGNYSFAVRARHKGDNEWKEMPRPLVFTIATPWFRTTWFRFAVVALAAWLVWFIIRSYYKQKLERERSVLEKQQAIEKERTRIATDMHDDFGASLSRIKFLSEKLQLYKTGESSESTDLQKISQFSDEMSEKMNEIVWALNQRYDSCADLVSFCRSYASEFLQDKNIKLIFSSSDIPDQKIQGEVRRNIFLVVKEALYNISRHAAATEAILSFFFDHRINLTIADNGKGFDQQYIRPFANGLDNMKKRMQDINGEIAINGENGTLIKLSAPL